MGFLGDLGRGIGNTLGITKPNAPQVGREAIAQYEQAPLNYSSTGGPVMSTDDVLGSMWGEYMRQNMGPNTGPVGTAERDAWIRREKEKFFANPQNQAYAQKKAQTVAAQQIAGNRQNELNNASNLSFDTGIASRGLLNDAAMGKAPSAAEMMMQRRAGEVARNAMSMARSAREYNPALQAQAINAGALSGVELGSQAAEMRANEMANARGQLLSADQASLGARQAQEGMRQNERQGLRQEYLGRDQMALGRAGSVAQMDLERQQYNAGQRAQATAAQMGAMGNTLQMGAGLAMMSDERAKKNVQSGAQDADAFMGMMKSKVYEYIDSRNGEGSRLGVMAQDVEKSPMGQKVVVESDKGKALDIPKATSALLASTARLHERLSKLEKNKGSKKR